MVHQAQLVEEYMNKLTSEKNEPQKSNIRKGHLFFILQQWGVISPAKMDRRHEQSPIIFGQ